MDQGLENPDPGESFQGRAVVDVELRFDCCPTGALAQAFFGLVSGHVEADPIIRC